MKKLQAAPLNGVWFFEGEVGLRGETGFLFWVPATPTKFWVFIEELTFCRDFLSPADLSGLVTGWQMAIKEMSGKQARKKSKQKPTKRGSYKRRG